MSDYVTFTGVVQFDPESKEANGKTLRNVSIRTPHSQASLRLTVWDGFSNVAIKRGDFVAGDGKYSSNQSTKQDGTPVTYHNISVTQISVVPCEVSTDAPRVANAGATSDKVPF